MKQSFNDILNYGSQIKNESIEFGSSIGEEFKGLIGNFKSDINPNIEKLQSHIENLQNRGEDISNNLSNDNSLKLWQLSHSFLLLNHRQLKLFTEQNQQILAISIDY